MALKSKSETTKKEETKTTEAPAAETTQETKAQDNTPAVREQAAAPATVAGGKSVFITNPDFVEAVADAEYGTFKSVTASNGSHMMGDVDLGKELKWMGIVQKDVWKVTPGSNDEEAKDYFQVSYDGETTVKGEPIEEALQDAIDAGYSKAAIKKYMDIIAVVVECEEHPDVVGETVTLQLAPSSVYNWKPISGRVKMKAAMGKLEATPIMGDPDLGSAVIFTSRAVPATTNGNKYTKFEFSV